MKRIIVPIPMGNGRTDGVEGATDRVVNVCRAGGMIASVERFISYSLSEHIPEMLQTKLDNEGDEQPERPCVVVTNSGLTINHARSLAIYLSRKFSGGDSGGKGSHAKTFPFLLFVDGEDVYRIWGQHDRYPTRIPKGELYADEKGTTRVEKLCKIVELGSKIETFREMANVVDGNITNTDDYGNLMATEVNISNPIEIVLERKIPVDSCENHVIIRGKTYEFTRDVLASIERE